MWPHRNFYILTFIRTELKPLSKQGLSCACFWKPDTQNGFQEPIGFITKEEVGTSTYSLVLTCSLAICESPIWVWFFVCRMIAFWVPAGEMADSTGEAEP